nr:hypothetical protein [Tanacetum cinerariifolium]
MGAGIAGGGRAKWCGV